MIENEKGTLGALLTVTLLLMGVWSLIAIPAMAGRSAAPVSKAEVIIVGTTHDIEASLDPALAYSTFSWDVIASLSSGLVDTLPGSDAGTGHIIPALATSWTMSSDGMIWDFELREGVTFADGRAFNATVVKYTFDRNCNLTGAGLAEPDGPQVNMGYSNIIKNVTVTGAHSVRFYLHAPFAPFLQLMSCAASYMVEPLYAPMNQVVSYKAGDPRGSTPCGLGPYQLENWTRAAGTDVEIRLEKNPTYWNATGGYPVTEHIIIWMYPSATSLSAALVTGEIDIACGQLTPLQVNAFSSNPSLKVWHGHGSQIQYMCFQQRTHPFDHVEVRRAIAACFNRTQLCQQVFLGTADPLYSMIPDGLAYHQESFAKYGDANYTYTGSVLAPLGFNVTNKLQVDLWYETSGHYPASAEQAAMYEFELEASGVITVSLHAAEWVSYRMLRNDAAMPVFVYGWMGHFADPDDYAFLPFAEWLNMGFNSTYGGTAEYDYWLKGRSATSDIARHANYSALQNLQADEASVIPLWQIKDTVVTEISVSGVSLDITERLYFWRLQKGASTTTTSTTTTTTTTSTTSATSTTTRTGLDLWGLVSTVVTYGSAAVIIIVAALIVRSRK